MMITNTLDVSRAQGYPSRRDPDLPKLSDLGLDLLCITGWQRALTLIMPFICVVCYFVCAQLNAWPLAVFALIYLSFSTYASTSHDLVHRNLGLSRRVNEILLTLIELLALRSGHAYRVVHLHHHRRFPGDDDLEGAASKMSLVRALIEGITFQLRLYFWALRRAKHDWTIIVVEGIGCAVFIGVAIAFVPFTLIPLVYVILMIMGSWILPLATAYIPHDPHGANELYHTRLFRGKVASVMALEHLYHLEHHLYPAVPHHNWPKLAQRLDPYFEAKGLKPIKLWF